MLIANVPEPMNLILVFKQTQRNSVHRRVAPPLVEEPSGSVQVVEICCISFAAPEIEGGDLEVGPEMAGGVAVCFLLVAGPVLAIRQPLHGVVGV